MSDLDVYKTQNFGNSSGWGRSPALLIVDFVNGFTDPVKFGGGNIQEAIENTMVLLDACRSYRLPIIFTRVVYADDGSDNGVFCVKAPSLATLTEDNPDSHVVDALKPVDGELIARKQQPSAFFGTNLHSWLTMRGVDTIIQTGCTTSGCVRASVIDALSYNYRNVIVTDCVGDRATSPHEANLFDMGQKYGDLLTCEETLEALARVTGIQAQAAE
ncbi:MAG: isochorismatase family protein [Rhodospirillaceae bacterium]|nr:isochorismatase family protein [Rhodospirillaceae bacterium]